MKLRTIYTEKKKKKEKKQNTVCTKGGKILLDIKQLLANNFVQKRGGLRKFHIQKMYHII